MRRLAAVLLLAAAGCGGGGRAGAELVVFAAASLTEPFGAIAAAFEASAPGVRVLLSFGPSDGLARQVLEGAPADVFAPADPRWIDQVAAAVPVADRAVFARNELVVTVPEGNPAGVRDLADLARPGLKVVLAGPTVPAGAYAREVLRAAGILEAVEANVVSNEVDVKGVVQKVLLGEADAGIAYVTDATGGMETVHIDPALNVRGTYPVAVVGDDPHPRADDFVAFVLGEEGRRILDRHGFLAP